MRQSERGGGQFGIGMAPPKTAADDALSPAQKERAISAVLGYMILKVSRGLVG
jgi:hypothetical protein